MKRTLLTLFFLSQALSQFAQSYNFRAYSIDEGLPQSQVHTMVQDAEGFIWMGTDGGGLSRFDGKNFVTYTDADGLSNDLVYAIVIGPDKKLWLGTNKGLSVFSNGKFLEMPEAFKQLQTLSIRTLFFDRKGKLWIGTNSGLYIYQNNSLARQQTGSDQIITTLFEDDAGSIWVGTQNSGIYRLGTDSSIKNFTTADGLNHNTAYAFAKRKEGGLLVGTDNGLNIINGDSVSKHSEPLLGSVKLLSRFICYDKDGVMWIGTWNDGVFRCDGSTMSHISVGEGLGANGVWCFLQDREGNIWFGTDGAGARRYGSQAITSISERNGLPDDMILSMCRTRT